MKRLLLLNIFCAAVFAAAAQKIISVSGEDTYYASSAVTLDDAKRIAVEQTRLKVLAAKFGTTINATTSIHIFNAESDRAESRTEVTTLAAHEVKGEWIEDTRAPEQEITYDPSLPNTTIIRTRVWGKAREIVAAKAAVDVRLLKDTLPEAETDVFRHEQDFYLSLQSPVDGYVAVYLLEHDEDMAYCLLPAENDPRGAVPVAGNRHYIFFSPEYAAEHYAADDQPAGTGYLFTTGRPVSYSQIYVLFSPQQFFKANDEVVKDSRYTLPRATSLHNFRQWLVRCKVHDTQLVEKTITVKITK